MKIILFLILLASSSFSQTVYEIPFASEGNEIELEVFNDSEINLNNVSVSVLEIPSWINISCEKNTITELSSKEKSVVSFNFDIEKEAKILEENSLKFKISGNNQTWNKEIRIKVLPPDKFELNQNYPNPFNPTTTISYILPAVASSSSLSQKVKLAVYDILGREVEILLNEEQKPGFYKIEWNANHLASGMYIYQLVSKMSNTETNILREKMLLLK